MKIPNQKVQVQDVSFLLLLLLQMGIFKLTVLHKTAMLYSDQCTTPLPLHKIQILKRRLKPPAEELWPLLGCHFHILYACT